MLPYLGQDQISVEVAEQAQCPSIALKSSSAGFLFTYHSAIPEQYF